MDRIPKSPHRPFQGSASQVTPYVPYQNPHNRPESPYGRSFSSSGGNTPRIYGGMTPPARPSSPSRHHRRTHSAPRPVKVWDSCNAGANEQETLNAEFQEDDGVRRVNHYILKREIGRGSFGVVHLGVDSSTGEEFVPPFPIPLARLWNVLIPGDQGIFKVKVTQTISVNDSSTDTYSRLGKSRWTNRRSTRNDEATISFRYSD